MTSSKEAINKPNGYDSDQGKTQRAGQTKANDVRTAESSGKETNDGDDGQRDTDEGGTSFTRDPNDRPAAPDLTKKGDEKNPATSDKRPPNGAALGDASADILPRSI